ncbi:hypothetical protein M493_06990 [Geobacillus genomosp. 3]|uniref:Uncharacterized protein n=1 Tax=Geobacillus genomosp. 3 TaxID=1921421 RepID=S5ZMS7_GEOG3|nr:hypothetical protein [Geobacillus genomosp. 3]AGT31688.1 hypothetical protein M493_06990 [Geobacillus genomosp. 3]
MRTDDDIRLGESKRAQDGERSGAAYIAYSILALDHLTNFRKKSPPQGTRMV